LPKGGEIEKIGLQRGGEVGRESDLGHVFVNVILPIQLMFT